MTMIDDTKPKKLPKITMYTSHVCPYCSMALKLLQQKGVDSTDIEKISIDQDIKIKEEMVARTQRRTVPQIFIGDVHVGGFDDLKKLDAQGKLTLLLDAS